MFIAAIFTEPKKWNQLRSLSSDQWKMKKMVYMHNETLLSYKRKQNPDIYR